MSDEHTTTVPSADELRGLGDLLRTGGPTIAEREAMSARLLAIPEREAHSRATTWLAAAAAVLLVVLGAIVWTRADEPPAPTAVASTETPRLIAVKFWHATCPACAEIAPRYAGVQDVFVDEPVLFVTFDMSTEASRAQSRLLADALGLGELYDDEFGATGFVVLVDAATRREIGRLTHKQRASEMERELASALSHGVPIQ